MALPLWDPIELPPDATLVDVNSIADEVLRGTLQALALEAWIEDTGEDPTARDWRDDEGIFAVYVDGEAVGVTIVTGIE